MHEPIINILLGIIEEGKNHTGCNLIIHKHLLFIKD